MRAVVVRQPWASLIAHGCKTIETRGFQPRTTLQPGDDLAIVAGRKRPADGEVVGPYSCERWIDAPHQPCLTLADDIGGKRHGWPIDLPFGAVVAVVRYDEALLVVAPMTDPPHDHLTPTTDGHLMWWAYTPVLGQRRWSARSRHPMLNERTVVDGRRDPDLDPQLPLGDFTPGRYGWMLSNPRRLTFPVPVKGRQGVFTLPDDVAAAVSEQLALGRNQNDESERR